MFPFIIKYIVPSTRFLLGVVLEESIPVTPVFPTQVLDDHEKSPSQSKNTSHIASTREHPSELYFRIIIIVLILFSDIFNIMSWDVIGGNGM